MNLVPLKKLPGVLSFSRRHVVTDAEMFSEIAGQWETNPIMVVRHGIRGTQNVNDGKGNIEQKTAMSGAREVSNIQQTETAKLDPRADAMVVQFGLAMLDLTGSLDACVAADKEAGKLMRTSVEDFVQRAKSSPGLTEVACRYARNIANGRWLWRNRTVAASIQVKVKKGTAVLATFDARSMPFSAFGDYSENERRVAEELARQLRGESLEGLTVVATLMMPVKGAVEVFPSQNYVENKPVGFARPLYKLGHPEPTAKDEVVDFRVMGRAAIRDQKLWNAIRTIDTWYPAFEETALPIAIEPLGASLGHQEFFRPGKAAAFEMFKRLCQIDPNSDEGMFCIAALDRGGVYGESDKAEKAAKATKGAEANE